MIGKRAFGLIVTVGVASCSALLLAAVEVEDPRIRSFISPERVVWKTGEGSGFNGRSSVSGESFLLAKGYGQVPAVEWGWKNRHGLLMSNSGHAASIILDFGREIHGGLSFSMGSLSSCDHKVRVRFGESVSETCSDAILGENGACNDHAIRDSVIQLPVMGTREIGNTGFRFVRIDLLTPGTAVFEAIRAVSLMRPMKQIGCFRCSDERLNRIFDTAVRTVHLCCQDYLWDGIKRDRLVWMGDTHPETKGILNVFGAASVLPESLDYMAGITPPDRWMNDMPTYTLWWLRNVAEWYRFTGDRSYLAKHAEYIRKTVEHVADCVDAGGSWRGDGKGEVWNFLDWPTKHNDSAATAGTQGLALIAAREAQFISEEMGWKTASARANEMVERISRQKLQPHGAKSAAALLALSGLRDPKEMFVEELGRDGHDRVSTFYGYYMIEAMSMAGENQRALDTVRDYWGAMLDVGATSFWEDFNIAWTNNCFAIDQFPVPGKKDVHGDYGEFCYSGFRHSLCHGWSCGPAAWCINHVLGISSTDVGCRKIRVKPFLGDLSWAEGAMALPGGEAVKVRVERGSDGTLDVKVTAPPGVEVER